MVRVPINNLGIPPLAGLCSYEEASKAGYSVERTVEVLKRYNYIESRLNEVFTAHIVHTPEWEVKCALSLHIWLDAEHAQAIRKRVSEMREPPLHLDKAPDERLRLWLDEVIRAANTIDLLVGIYRVVKPEMMRSVQKHLAEMNVLLDHPTYRILRIMLQEEEEMIAWGEQALAALIQDTEGAQCAQHWEEHLRAYLLHAGGLLGDLEAPASPMLPAARADGERYKMNVIPQRDKRFTNSFDQSHWKYIHGAIDTTLDKDECAFALIYRRLREMDVPEYMGPMIYYAEGRPWEYYVDMSRQLWDEARHAMMGEVGLYANGMAFYEYPVELEGSVALNSHFSPLEAHMVLWNIEQGLMRRDGGKRYEWEAAQLAGDALVTAFQDYDWADEVLHAQIGRRWLVPLFGSQEKLKEAAERLSAKWGVEMDKLIPPGPHEEWWPKFVADLRQRRSILE